MSPIVGGSKVFWTDFIKLYESLPELWNTRSDCYKNRVLKHQAYNKLIGKLKEIEPNANREVVRRKINSLRCSYRRELNKMRANRKTAAAGEKEDIYSTNLWYFGLLGFLRDCESSQVPTHLTTQSRQPSISSRSTQGKKIKTTGTYSSTRKTPAKDLEPRMPSPSPCPCATRQEAEYDRIGRAWAAELQKMDVNQQIYAKRAVAEIIFKGQLGILHREATVINNGVRMASEDECTLEIEKSEPDFDF